MIIALTVSTNYSDILKITITQNLKFFDRWIIITDSNDVDTINLIKKTNNNKLIILFYDFQNNNNIFDKGGAIKKGQEYIYNHYNDILILLLDTDIYLPDNFKSIIESQKYETNTMYGPQGRYYYYTIKQLKNKKYIKTDYNSSTWVLGYFQMYYYNNLINNKKLFYEESRSADTCDLQFLDNYKSVCLLEFMCHHLGNKSHWEGRFKKDFLIKDSDIKQYEILQKKKIYNILKLKKLMKNKKIFIS